jgi:hypothetical protein
MRADLSRTHPTTTAWLENKQPFRAVADFQKYRCLTSGSTLPLCAYTNGRFRLQTPGQRPGGPKAISYQSTVNLKLRLISWSGLTQ